MKTTAKFEGVDKVSAAFASMAARVIDATPQAVQTSLEKIQRQQRTFLSLGWHPPGTRTGSIAPAPPWRISGDLSRSVWIDRPRPHGVGRWDGAVGPTARYGRIQELGGVAGRGHRSHLPARPSLKPAWDIVRPTLPRVFYDAWHVHP